VRVRKKARKNLLFLKKKKQKDFCTVGFVALGCPEFRPKRTKVFGFDSSEKKSPPLFSAYPPSASFCPKLAIFTPQHAGIFSF